MNNVLDRNLILKSQSRFFKCFIISESRKFRNWFWFGTTDACDEVSVCQDSGGDLSFPAVVTVSIYDIRGTRYIIVNKNITQEKDINFQFLCVQ